MFNEIYYKLETLKKMKGKLDWDAITYSELFELFKDCPDSIIASLYDVDTKEVKKKRYKWNIKFQDIVAQHQIDKIKKISESVPPYKSRFEPSVESDKANMVLGLFNELTKEEQNYFILQLSEPMNRLNNVFNYAEMMFLYNEAMKSED